MRNAGSVPVEGVSVEWSCEEGEAPYLAVETEELGASLPLHPGQLLTAPLRMRGQLLATSCRTEDCLSVAGSESRWSASGQDFNFAAAFRIRIRMFLDLPDPHPDPFSHKYGSGSFHGQVNIEVEPP
jgi:hypothetical protein